MHTVFVICRMNRRVIFEFSSSLILDIAGAASGVSLPGGAGDDERDAV